MFAIRMNDSPSFKSSCLIKAAGAAFNLDQIFQRRFLKLMQLQEFLLQETGEVSSAVRAAISGNIMMLASFFMFCT